MTFTTRLVEKNLSRPAVTEFAHRHDWSCHVGDLKFSVFEVPSRSKAPSHVLVFKLLDVRASLNHCFSVDPSTSLELGANSCGVR